MFILVWRFSPSRDRKRFLSKACRYAIAITQVASSLLYQPIPKIRKPRHQRGECMVKQNVALQNADGSHRCWLAPKEVDRMLKNREVRRVVEKGKPVKYRMVAYPGASSSEQNAALITAAEMRMLPSLTERELKRLTRDAMDPITDKVQADRVKWVQRLMGHGLIDFNATLADATVRV